MTPMTVAALAERSGQRIVDGLQIDDGAPVRLIVAEGRNEAVGRTISVAPREGGGMDRAAWLELLITHELTHVVVASAWGEPPALLWEGLPVWFGDAYVRERVLGRSYAVECRALLELDRLRPLAPLWSHATYYGERKDYRVDVQAGAFCGWLLATIGPSRLPTLALADLSRLEPAWHDWLRESVPRDAARVDRLRALNLCRL